MASNAVNRAGVIIPPSLPTIKETTLSWLGSELDSSIFSTKGCQSDNDPAARQLSTKNIQRYIDFDEQCLSLKSGEESDFSGIQPLPMSSDDTPPAAPNEFNRVAQMDLSSLLGHSQNRPKPELKYDGDQDIAYSEKDNTKQHQNPPRPVNASNIHGLLETLDNDISNQLGSGDNAAVEKLQLIRLWQLMQQEDLRRRQEAEIAVLNAQREKMQMDRDQSSKVVCLEEIDPGMESQDLDDVESAGFDLNAHCEVESYKEPNVDGGNDLGKSALADNYDDIPVENDKRSFEQLLEEELRKENNNKSVVEQTNTKGPVKRPFLRKGEGLARFKGPPVRKAKPQSKDNIKKVAKPNLFSRSAKESIETTAKIPHKPPTGHKKEVQLKDMHVQKIIPKVSDNKLTGKTQDMQTPVPCPVTEDIFSYCVPEDSNNNHTRYFRPAGDADLEEFEMLERYAEDDASFFNEPSLVASVLRQESPSKDENQKSLRDRVKERRRLREESRSKVQDIQTRIEIQSIDQYENVGSQVDDDEILSPLPPKPYFKSPEKQQSKTIQRKTASLVRKEKLVRPVAQSPSYSPNTTVKPCNSLQSNHLDIRSSPNSAFSAHPKPAQSQQEDCFANDCVLVDDFQDDQTWGDINVSVNAASQQESKSDNSPKKYKCSDYMELENEDAENPVRDTNPTPLSSARGLSLSPPPPPTSLMQKLFPSLKVPKPSLSTMSQSQSVTSLQDHAGAKIEAGDNQASLLKQKLEELESEISRFKKENLEVEKVRKKQEEDTQKFAREVEEFRKQKDEELARLEEYKKTETKKLKKERKLFEEHVLATKSLPRKEEREEIQKLHEEMENLNAEHQSKEQKWHATCNRLRSQISSLRSENEELQERIDEIETQRIKERKLLKSKVAKQPSIWEAVNDLVDATVIETGKDFPKGHSHPSSNQSKKQAKSKSKKPEKKPPNISPEIAISNLRDTLAKTNPNKTNPRETMHDDGKVERLLPDGRKVVVFPNGTQKEISSDGKTVKVCFQYNSTVVEINDTIDGSHKQVHFANGDIKEIYGDGSIVYYYHENGTTHTTHPDGLQVFEFPNNQVEHHFCDGTKQITFPDQTVKYLHTDGTEQTVFPDGTEMHIAANKDKTIVFANGQREVHTDSFKRREYPDGTSKTVFEDGRQETRYASGRLRVKDMHGNVIVDRMTT